MFSIKFRRKRAPGSKQKRFGFARSCYHATQEQTAEELIEQDTPAARTTSNMYLSVESFVDDDELNGEGPPDLMEESFTSSSFDGEDDSSLHSSLNSCALDSSSSGRRVSFLLPSSAEKGNKRSLIVARSSAFSAQSLLKGDIPLSKPQANGELDITSAGIPGNKIWLVGNIPELPLVEEEDSVVDDAGEGIEDLFVEDVPYEETRPKAHQRKTNADQAEPRKTPSCDEVPFDEICDCCKEKPTRSCAICHNVKVFETSPGCWQINSNESRLTISLPPSTTLKTVLKRNIVIESDLPGDMTVYVDEKGMKGWNVESFLLVLVQLVMLKVSASI